MKDQRRRKWKIIWAMGSCLLGPAAWLRADGYRLALLGSGVQGSDLESLAARVAVDDYNRKVGSGRFKVKLATFFTRGGSEGVLESARRACADPAVLGVVSVGEEAADRRVLRLLEDAGLPMVMATSWAAARPEPNAATWLCPNQLQLAAIAAAYAAKGMKVVQAAVVDNSAPTAAAAASAFGRLFKELGGRVNYSGEWQGSSWGLTRTVSALGANWPQVVFFLGEGAEAGRLVQAMRRERRLKETRLLGLPGLLSPDFARSGGMAARLSTAVFPAPDYRGGVQLQRTIGLGFSRGSPNHRAYAGYAYRKPGRWTSMVFDGTKLLVDAILTASLAGKREPTRIRVREAMDLFASYNGIRGRVKFGQKREPLDVKAMIFYALPKVNGRKMEWYDKEFGPPFR